MYHTAGNFQMVFQQFRTLLNIYVTVYKSNLVKMAQLVFYTGILRAECIQVVIVNPAREWKSVFQIQKASYQV